MNGRTTDFTPCWFWSWFNSSLVSFVPFPLLVDTEWQNNWFHTMLVLVLPTVPRNQQQDLLCHIICLFVGGRHSLKPLQFWERLQCMTCRRMLTFWHVDLQHIISTFASRTVIARVILIEIYLAHKISNNERKFPCMLCVCFFFKI